MSSDTRQEPHLSPLTLEWDESQAWLRVSDRMRAEGIIHALTQERANVLVSADQPAVLDHYSRLLVRRLKQVPGAVVEVVFSTTTEVLLQRFNQWLAAIPLHQAREAPLPSAPLRILVINDSGAVSQSEWQVMVRLANDFPGVNVRVLLVMDQGPEVEKRRTLLGRQHVHWWVSAPESAEVQHLIAQTPHHQRAALKSWLVDLGVLAPPLSGEREDSVKRQLPSDVSRSNAGLASDQSAVPSARAATSVNATPPATAQAWPEILPPPMGDEQRKSRRRAWVLGGLLMATLLISAAVVLAWYRADAPEILKKLDFVPIQQNG